MSFQNKPTPKACGRCGKVFQCKTIETHGDCWCTLYPPFSSQDLKGDCLCSDCLGLATLFPASGEKE